jgi:hypothetical protein
MTTPESTERLIALHTAPAKGMVYTRQLIDVLAEVLMQASVSYRCPPGPRDRFPMLTRAQGLQLRGRRIVARRLGSLS